MTSRPADSGARVSLIWAMGENRVIGMNNKLPWHLPADLRHFRLLTSGHPILMGRKTYESFGKPLPDRTHIIITSDRNYKAAPGCLVVHSVEAALQAAYSPNTSKKLKKEIFVIGGASLYAQTFPLARRLYITLIHADFNGDTRFPDFNWKEWREIERKTHQPDNSNPYPYSFITLQKT
ncbi:MAG TPA: dihydrofolate reductase [Acidiferrobacterales bacterium]|nr:dihydrofolate reductase [Acidiferrobacterales bacterium]